jgi:diguanylate cyclase
MLQMRQDDARSDELFAVIENALRDERRWTTAPTALLRLKGAIQHVAQTEACLAALEDLRSTASGRRQTVHHAAFSERLAHVFGTRVAPPALAVLRIAFEPLDALDDRHGSPAPSQLLQIALARVLRAVRSADLVTQLDEREFACVLLDLPTREELTHVACKMLDRLSQPVQLGERQLSLLPSIGIAMCPDDGDTPDELLQIAGAAMRRAGDQGNGYAFSDARAERWASQFTDLAKA